MGDLLVMVHEECRSTIVSVARRLRGGISRRAWSLGAMLTASCSAALSQVSPATCGPVSPTAWDYRVDKQFYALVEDAHFTPPVEALIRGRTGQLPGPDIDYTLSVFPNHYRAIMAATRLAEREESQGRKSQLKLPVECYYERAVRFKPDDLVARMLYAQFLGKRKREEEAKSHLRETQRRAKDNPLTLRNIGLVYMELKDYDNALMVAHRLLEVEPADPVLKGALVSAGKWRDPVAGTVLGVPAAASGPGNSASGAAAN
jgi:hypothetical protein